MIGSPLNGFPRFIYGILPSPIDAMLSAIRVEAFRRPQDHCRVWLAVWIRSGAGESFDVVIVCPFCRSAPGATARRDVDDVSLSGQRSSWSALLWRFRRGHSLSSVFLRGLRFRFRSTASEISGTLQPITEPKTRHPVVVSSQ